MPSPRELSRRVRSRAMELGFELCGIARARRLDEHEERLTQWISRGMHGEMSWFERNHEKRIDPARLVEGAVSVIVVAMSYNQENPSRGSVPEFSSYALGKDYHKVIKDRLHTLLGHLNEADPGIEGRVFVDSAPVLERAWAVEAGLGWTGRNSLLINRNTGSWLFLGSIITTAELEYDTPFSADYCGTCTRCIDACPTGAILNGKVIDARKCISYLTIEKRGEFAPSDAVSLHGKVFGCDVCQEVCPWNRRAASTKEEAFSPLPEIASFSLSEWEAIDPESFEKIFSESPVLRTGYDGFIRNLRHL